MKDEGGRLDELVSTVIQSPKYQRVSLDLVRKIGARELTTRRSFTEAVKATKNKLHQVGGAYFESKLDYAAALAQIQTVAGDETAVRSACLDVMRRHASTNERLPILSTFYQETLTGLNDVRRVLDLACGLNPLSRLWMPLPADVEYIASDIYADLVGFVGQFMEMMGMNGRAEVRDLITDPPTEQADLILLLKILPVLEQIEKGTVPRLLDALNGRSLLISFPARSLGGRQKGMAKNYEAQFRGWADGRGWHIQRFRYPTELAFLVTTQ